MDKFRIFSELSGKMSNDNVLKWKNEGKPVMGLTCSNIPEEVVHSAGFLPIRIRANSVEDTSYGDANLHRISCSYVRSALEILFSDNRNFFDGIIATNTCDHHLNLADFLHHKAEFPLHYFQMHHTNTEGGRDLFINEMKGLIRFLKDRYSISIEDSDIRASIITYNKTRALMNRLNEFRKKNPPLLSGTEFMKVVLAGMTIRKEEFNVYLEYLISELSQAESGSDKLPRLMIFGAACDSPEFITFIENRGFSVAADNLCFGSRHYHGNIDENSDDLLSAIAERYFQTISCASVMNDFDRNYDMIINVIEEMNIQGIIVARLKFCDHFAGFSKMLKDAMSEKKGIPVLDLEREYSTTGSGQISTRLQAFHELIKK
ncbi:MAG: 2-hydroxyacyl-CoA dehydratase [Syntrophaceae bacterium]|nr:2-hydroxyacyl-CoA dehydratase [Syntrophaceae bacterium]